MQAWLPLADAVLCMASMHLPPPMAAAPLRAAHLTASARTLAEETLAVLPRNVRAQLAHTLSCIERSERAPDAPVVTFVAKMVAMPAAAVPLAPGERLCGDPAREVFLGFGRVFSGVLRVGQRVHVLSPLYTALNPQKHRCGFHPQQTITMYPSPASLWLQHHPMSHWPQGHHHMAHTCELVVAGALSGTHVTAGALSCMLCTLLSLQLPSKPPGVSASSSGSTVSSHAASAHVAPRRAPAAY
jgi:hypothetical protein